MSGKLLQLNMDGKGKTEVSMVNALTTLELRLKKRVEGNLIFGVVDKMNTELLDAEDMHLMFQNIFGGNKDLEDSIHVLMNENWRSFFGIVRPGINEAINVIMRRNVEKILEFVPISLVLDGINDVQ
uniref:Uncharacterized protein n=1 Tax=Stomoxys calcitrans TaxID=35570 RepID=A0A1I8PHV7_STOCA